VVAQADRVNAPASEPLARRAFRHPATGHEVALVVERGGITGGAPQLVWKIWMDEAPGSPPAVAKLRYMNVHETVEAARRGFAERQRALRAAGYEREE
jgi:hypothetical protein